MGNVMKRTRMLSLFSTLVILAAVLSFSTSAKAMIDTEKGSNLLSNLENVDTSATFDLTKDGIQEEKIYDADSESNIRVEHVDTGYVQYIYEGEWVHIPVGVSTFNISTTSEFSHEEYEVKVWRFREDAPLYILSVGNEIVEWDYPDFPLEVEFSSTIMNPIEDYYPGPAWSRLTYTYYDLKNAGNLALEYSKVVKMQTVDYYGSPVAYLTVHHCSWLGLNPACPK
ncbi:hypothetical protein [Jeotgalibacillus marinus]|uniref:Uncharacterized protein n=1 Tax=Jeotgalibacillus marinus TaxID=86667 RepID=A0ABV3Q8U9_9BACL